MPRSKSATRGTNGSGSIRKVTKTSNGKTYSYWQARYTVGFDPITGKQIQHSINGKTKAEVAQKLRQVTAEIDQGTYIEPCRLTVEEWLTIWLNEYLNDVRPSTAYNYKRNLELHIMPQLGKARLEKLSPQMVQRVYNDLSKPKNSAQKPLHPKSVKDVHGVLHKALDQAVKNGYLKVNPCNVCVLPRAEKTEIKPLEQEQIQLFLKAIEGHVHEYYYKIALFTGLREGEMLGLTWDCVDFERGMLTVKQQLRKSQEKGGEYYVAPTKNGKQRVIALAPSVVDLFRMQKRHLQELELAAGGIWMKDAVLFSSRNEKEQHYDLVFRNEMGDRLSYRTVYDCFKRVVAELGMKDARIHDLRHTYAVISFQSGDDVKTIQSNLGHATAAFTLDVYGHVNDQMKKDSATRLEQYIQSIQAT